MEKLLKQLPSLEAIQWEEDRRILSQHYEARLRGETLGNEAEYIAAGRQPGPPHAVHLACTHEGPGLI